MGGGRVAGVKGGRGGERERWGAEGERGETQRERQRERERDTQRDGELETELGNFNS